MQAVNRNASTKSDGQAPFGLLEIRKVNWEFSRNAQNAAASSSMGRTRYVLKLFGLRVLARWFVACIVSSGEGG
jgi:hypothetical protein